MSLSITDLDQGTYPPLVAVQTAWRCMLLARLASRLLIHCCGKLRFAEDFVVMGKVRMVFGGFDQNNGPFMRWTKRVNSVDGFWRSEVTASQMV